MPKLLGGVERQEVPFLRAIEIAGFAVGKAEESSKKLRRKKKARERVRSMEAMAIVEERRAEMQSECVK